MENRKDIEDLKEAKELFTQWLEEKKAIDVIEHDESEELFPYSHQVQGIVNGRWCHAIFTLVKDGMPHIQFDYKGTHGRDLTPKDFIQVLASVEIDKPEYTLERFKLSNKEQLIVTHEMCEEENEICTFYEIKQKLN